MKERKITELLKENTRIYFWLCDKDTEKRFLRDATAQGFRFADGVKPTRRKADSIMAINNDLTINYVGYIGHIAFMGAETIDEKTLLRVDYKKFADGCDNYIYSNEKTI